MQRTNWCCWLRGSHKELFRGNPSSASGRSDTSYLMKTSIRLSIILLTSLSAFAQNGTITHFIYLTKENRSFDSYFGSFPGVQSYCAGGHSPASTVCYAPNDATSACTSGDTCPYPIGSGASDPGDFSTGGLARNFGIAQPLLLESAGGNYADIPHTHDALLGYMHGGLMDEFSTTGCMGGMYCYSGNGNEQYGPVACSSNTDCTNPSYPLCESPAQVSSCGYAYFDSTQIGPYYAYATTYGLSDNFFSGAFPSQPGHMYIFAASSNGISDNGGTLRSDGGKTCQTGPNTGNSCSCTGSTCNDAVSCGASTPSCSDKWSSSWTCEASKTGSAPPFLYEGHEFSVNQYSTATGGVCLSGPKAGASCSSNSTCPASVCSSTLTGQPAGLYCTSNTGMAQPGPVACSHNSDCSDSSYPQCRGTGYAGGTCSNGNACTCWSNAGYGGAPSSNCTDIPDCGSSSPTCNIASTVGNTPGAPCPQLTTIGDQMDAADVSWKYYTSDAIRNAAAMFSTIRYGYCSNSHTSLCTSNSACGGGKCVQDFASHVPIWSNGSRCTNATCGGENQFLSDAATAGGWCSNNHAKSCSLNSQCSAGGTCVDNSSTMLPTVSFIQPGSQNPDSNEHPSNGPVGSGVAYTETVLDAVFSNPYLYNHSVIFITWDDSGGFWDHVPPPMQDGLNLGARVPLMCIGPYCRNAVNHLQMEFASVLKCVESLFGVSPINSRDAKANDACFGTGTKSNPGVGPNAGMLNLAQAPIPPAGSKKHSVVLPSD
jgi:phospholipase C